MFCRVKKKSKLKGVHPFNKLRCKDYYLKNNQFWPLITHFWTRLFKYIPDINKKTLQFYMFPDNQIEEIEPKRQKTYLHPVKTQVSLCICAVWSESSLTAFWIVKGVKFLYADNEDSDQTTRMRSLIWVFVGYRCQRVRYIMLRIKYKLDNTEQANKLY